MKRVVDILATVLFAAVSVTAADSSSLRKAPELAFTVPGQGQKLLSQYRGKVVALEFVWTTCPHCQAASRYMSTLQKEYGPKGLQVLAVAVDENADLKVENFVKDNGVNFPVGFLPNANPMIAFMGWQDGLYVVPQQVLIDRQGMIHYQTPKKEDETWDKLMKEDTIRAHIEELLGPTSAAKRTPSAKVATVHKPS